jgi:protein arginine kinase activator
MVCKEKAATVYFSNIVGDKVQKINICEECAKKKGVTDPTALSLADLLFGPGAGQAAAPADGDEVRCPGCGYSQAEFKKAGRLGCSTCYTTFRAGLETLLKTMHKGTRHTGKIPHTLKHSRDLKLRAQGLQKKLDKAVLEEDFEAAARLRDEIKALVEKLGALTSA